MASPQPYYSTGLVSLSQLGRVGRGDQPTRVGEQPWRGIGGAVEVLQLDLGDRVRLRKPHPCGGYEWVVIRLGADIGLQCTTCARRILLPRSTLRKRVKQVIKASDPPQNG